MRRAALVYNPAAGRRRARAVRHEVAARLQEADWSLEEHATEGPGHATRLARELAAGGRLEAVFALGGDGTLREVAAGLLGTEVALGALPAGTANVLGRSLGLSRSSVEAAASLARAPRRPFTVGMAGATPFLMMVSAGFDAHVVGGMGALKRRFGMPGILLQGAAQLAGYAFPRVEVRWEGGTDAGGFAALCNIPEYGGPMRLAPGASWSSPTLELVVHRGWTRVSTLGFARHLLLGRHLQRADVACHTVESATLAGPPGLCLQVDGDACGEALPVTVRVADRPLWVLAPAGTL